MTDKLPQDALAPKDAAKKYGFKWDALRMAIYRKKVKPIRYGSRWYVTDREMKRYLRNRDERKIPKRYRKKA